MMINLTDMKTVRSILGRHGFHFSKKLGQNFLIDPSVCPRIAEEGNAAAGYGVLEIGPGIGTLTQQLALRAEKVTSVELDQRLLPILEETVGEFENLHILHGDILQFDVPQLLEQAGKAVDTVPLYRVQTDLRKRELLLQELADTDYVFLASASAARAFAEMTAGTETAAKLISIGNATTKAAETAGLSVAETAVQSDIAGMIACIRKENEV